MPSPTPIDINLNIEIDAESKITILGAEPIAPDGEIIVPEYQLPVSALYDVTGKTVNKALIMYWEPSDDVNNTAVAFADGDFSSVNGYTMTDAGKKSAKALGEAIQMMLCSGFDCSDSSSPFYQYVATGPEAYYKYDNFGRVAVSAMANDILGTPGATVAITNEKEFIERMLSLNAGAGEGNKTAQERYDAWKYSAPESVTSADWVNTNSPLDANLTRRIVRAILDKGQTTTYVNSATSNTLSEIVKQVLGKDASRAMDEDNNQFAPDHRVPLKFIPGDKIYFNIKVKSPEVTLGVNNGQNGRVNAEQEHNYVIKTTLVGSGAPAPVITPENPINVTYDGQYIIFDLPNTAQYLDFVDVLIGENYYKGWADPSSVGDGEFQLDITDTTVTVQLPVLVTGTVQIFTRYDKYTNSADPGFYELVTAPIITPENPINVSYDGQYIYFDLPNTAQYLDFVDVLIGENYYKGWADPSSVGVGQFQLDITDTTVTVQLPVLVTGTVQIFTRYDKYTNSADPGFYELVASPSFIRYGINQTLLTPVDTNLAYGVKVDGVDKHVQINAAAGMEGGVAIIAYTFAELSSSSTISIKHKGTNYNISSTILNTWEDGQSPNVTINYQLTSSSSSLLSITDAGLYFIRIGETNDGNSTPVIALTKINNISLIGDAVGNWVTDVQLTRVSEYVYQASNVQFNYGNPFKIRTNNAWSNTANLDIEADSNNQNRIYINGDMNIPFIGISGAYDVKLYLTDLKNLALELTPYVAPAINPFYTGNEVPFTITDIDVPYRRLFILSNGSYTGDINIQVVINSNFLAENGVNFFNGENNLNAIGTITGSVSAAIQTGDTLQLYRLYDVDGVTKLTTPVALSNIFTIPAPTPTIQVVSGTAGGNMTFKFTPNVTASNVSASFSSDGTTYNNYHAPFSVTNGSEYTFTNFVASEITSVRFVIAGPETVIAGPVSVPSAPAQPSYPISITSIDKTNRQLYWRVESVPSGIYEFQYSTDGTIWNLACAADYSRVGGIFTELNDVPFDTSVYMSAEGTIRGIQINANYYTGAVNGVLQYVSVPSDLTGVKFRAVLSSTDTWNNTGAFNKPTPLTPIQVVSAEFTVV